MSAARRSCALLIAWLAAGPALTEETQDKEDFLRNAQVIEKEVIREGITLPEAIQLERAGLRRRAAFKTREVYFPDQNIRIGQEIQKGLRDSWKFEVAAYELDKLLGLGMVPVTVEREIEGKRGAVIEWIEGVLPEFGASPEGFDSAAWEDQAAAAWLFDYLAYNIDRTSDNLLVTDGFKVRLIDHSRAFQRLLIPMRPLSRFPREAIKRLRETGDGDFRKALGRYLTNGELDTFFERKKLLLERVDSLLRSRPESEVLF